MSFSSRNSQRGFSLVELMVVVAIIGVLAAVAVPNITKYLAKARQSEAKTMLSSIYTSEKAFFAEYTAYHSMFGAIGYSPEGKLRYNAGFGQVVAQAGAGNGYNNAPTAAPRNTTNTSAYCGTTGVIAAAVGCTVLRGATNAVPPAVPSGTGAGQAFVDINTFRAAAVAVIHSSGGNDIWTIDQNKELLNSTPGIP